MLRGLIGDVCAGSLIAATLATLLVPAGSGFAETRSRPAATAMMGTPATASRGKELSARPLSRGASTGLPLPRYASLRSDPVNLRKGPGTHYPLAWIYRRAGLPVEIVQEFEGWRQIRDADSATGWVLAALLSGRRTVVVLPWEGSGKAPALVALRTTRRASADVVARLEPGSVASVKSCDGAWCDVTIEAFRGYIDQRALWGVYPGEAVR